jgi:ribonuclease Z
LKVTILGNNSALPAFGRYPTAQVVDINEQLFLMDCGEGCQMRMQQFNIKSDRINHIFISHVHGDHYLGLVGFISSMSLKGRERDLYLYCPKEIKKIIELQLPFALGYTIHYNFLEEGKAETLVNEEKFQIDCFPVYHSVPTHGFKFIEKKRKRVLVPNNLRDYEIPKYFYKRLTDGEDYTYPNGEIIKNEWVTQAGLPQKVYCFAADTRFAPEIIPYIALCDLLYHETTYTEENSEKATQRFHSTAKQAATIALEGKIKKLLIGHFSSKYKDLQPFLTEAKPIFENTELALEGMVFEI